MLDTVLLCFIFEVSKCASNQRLYVYICTFCIYNQYWVTSIMLQGTSTTHFFVSYRGPNPTQRTRDQFGAGEVPELFCCLEFEAKRRECSKLGPLPEPWRFQGLVAVRLIGLLGCGWVCTIFANWRLFGLSKATDQLLRHRVSVPFQRWL